MIRGLLADVARELRHLHLVLELLLEGTEQDLPLTGLQYT